MTTLPSGPSDPSVRNPGVRSIAVGPGCMRAFRLRNLEDRKVLRLEAPL